MKLPLDSLRVSRRELLVAGASTIATLPTTLHAQSIGRQSTRAFGTVFEDQRGHRQRHAGDRGIPGVLVSNGCDIVATDPDGRWALDVAPGQHIFVIKPPHWSSPSLHGNVPSFSYLHQATNGPVEIDFPLRSTPEPTEFDVALVADTQPSNLVEVGYLRQALLAPLARERVAFAINHGDVVGDDLTLFDSYRNLIGTTSFPWHHCPGNHDMDSASPDGVSAFETWKRVFGPPHYAFQAGTATFIVLNTVDYAGYPRPRPDMPAYRGWIGARQLAFVANLLRHVPADHLIVVSMHIPLASYEDPNSISDRVGDRDALLEMLRQRRHTVSFGGHLHTTEHHYFGTEFGFRRGRPHHHHVLTAACGGWWTGPLDPSGVPLADSRDGSPKGFHILSVDGNQYETRFVATVPAQMRVLITTSDAIGSGTAACGQIISSPLPREATGGAQVVVDVFDGGPNTRVHLAIDGLRAHGIELQRAMIPDPYIVEAYADPTLPRPSWLKPCPSSHMWVATLPDALAPGQHVLTVRVTGEFGREHLSHTNLTIT